MPSSTLPRTARTALFALAFALGCGGAPEPAAKSPGAAESCDPQKLASCERSLSAELRAPAELARAYANARAERDPKDPWARLVHELDTPSHPQAAIVLQTNKRSIAAPQNAKRIQVPALPAPESMSTHALLLSLAGALGYDALVLVEDSAVYELFPADPLAPFIAGLPSVVRVNPGAQKFETDLAIDARIRKAFVHAGAFRYVEAAAEAEALRALLEAADPNREPVLRGRYALQTLTLAGIALDPPEDDDDKRDTSSSRNDEAPPISETDTPYGDLLRVRLSKDEDKEWSRRSAKILAASPADRREALDAFFGRTHRCDAHRSPPPMEGVRDLIFAHKLASSLLRDSTDQEKASHEGKLPLRAWLERYKTLLRLVDETHTAWAFVSTLFAERGEAFGLSPAGTNEYERVHELGLQHLAASKKLQSTHPGRYRALALVGLMYSPGAHRDAPVQKALIDLTQATVQDRLARARDAGAVFNALVTGVLSGFSYPTVVQEAYFSALQGAFVAKLRGDLVKSTGWPVAGLFALDGAYRLLAQPKSDLSSSSAQIARALSDPSIPHPALARLASASARYAALAAGEKLNPSLTKSSAFPPERREARKALRDALAGLGEAGEAPSGLVDEISDLGDGLIATLATVARDSRGNKDPSCKEKRPIVLTPVTRRSLGKLGDLRRRILASPSLRKTESAWARRARLVVTLLSDALDIAAREGKNVAFALPAREAVENVQKALADWDDKTSAEALVSLYALGRSYSGATDASSFFKENGSNLRRALAGLYSFFKAGDGADTRKGISLLDALSTIGFDKLVKDKPEAALRAYAEAFYTQDKPDQGDLLLLGALALAGTEHVAPSEEAVSLAKTHKSRVAWALAFLREIDGRARGHAPNPAAYKEAMLRAADDGCQRADAGQMIAVMQAASDFAQGERAKAREALDKVLDAAEAKGLVVPRMTYRYEEKTSTRVFALSLEVSYGAGLLSGANSFQVGFGVRSPGEPGGSLTTHLASLDTASAGDEAARYYLSAAALSSVFHLLEGDMEHAQRAASRVIGALNAGVRLGTRALKPGDLSTWAADARPLIAISAELFAEAGHPLLAGDLWTIVQASLKKDTDDEALAKIFDGVPIVLTGVPQIGAIVERTKKTLVKATAGLACTSAKVDEGAGETWSCDAYPLALSLRVVDAIKKLPRLGRTGASGPRCEALAAMDDLLGSLDKGIYDPDVLSKAVMAAQATGSLVDAAVLLTRQRQPLHCGPLVVDAARSLGRSPWLGPSQKADLLSVALNCLATMGDATVNADLVELDQETRKLGDASRNLELMLKVANLGAMADRWEMLHRLSAQPDFVDRWLSVHPNATATALLLSHASAIIAGDPVDAKKSENAYTLVCETFAPGERAELCTQIKGMRSPSKLSAEERKKAAKEAVKRLLSGLSVPRKP